MCVCVFGPCIRFSFHSLLLACRLAYQRLGKQLLRFNNNKIVPAALLVLADVVGQHTQQASKPQNQNLTPKKGVKSEIKRSQRTGPSIGNKK